MHRLWNPSSEMTLSVKSRKGHRHITQTWSGRDRIGTLAHRAFTPVLCALYLPVVKTAREDHSILLYIGVSRKRSAANPRCTFSCHDTNGANIRRAGSTPAEAACNLRLSMITCKYRMKIGLVFARGYKISLPPRFLLHSTTTVKPSAGHA